MGSDRVENLWKKVLGEIQTEVSGANFLTLFKNTSLISFDEGVATIAAPSAIVIDLLNKRFYDVIKNAVDHNSGEDAKIILVPRTPIIKTKEEETGPLFSSLNKPK